MTDIRYLIFSGLIVALVGTNFAERDGPLVRASYVYKGVIKGVHDYFNNTCILMMYASPGPIKSQELEKADTLVDLHRYFSLHLHVRSVMIDLQQFIEKVGTSYFHIKRPLFILLNDNDDLRDQFTYISTWITMAYPTWLIFLRNSTRISEFFSNTYIPFDCIFLVAREDNSTGAEEIHEIYQINREDRIRTSPFGGWNQEEGFRAPTSGLYQRRNNLNGQLLRVTTVQDPPISVIKRNHHGEIEILDGFFGKVLELLEEGINCTFSYTEAKSWGVRLENGSWTGALRMLIQGEADLAATELMMTSDRLDAVKFTTPVYATKSRAFIKRPESRAVKWDAYLAPFAEYLWNAIGVLILIASGTVLIIESCIRRFFHYSEKLDRNSTRATEVFFYVFGAFCNQGMQPSRLDPIRLVHLTVHLTAVIILAAYSAALISFLAVKTFVMPFTTMEGLLQDGTYRFAVVSDSADYTFFQNTTDKVMAVMFNELLTRETDLPKNYLDGLQRICSQQKYAFMIMDNMATVLEEEVECTLESLDVMMQSTVAMAVPIGSPYKGIIDSNILLLRDSGILQRLLNIEWSVQTRRPRSTWSSVEIEDVLPLLLFILIAFFIAAFILLMERAAFQKFAARQRTQAKR